MKPSKELILNSSFLRDRLTELDIKQWWLAEQVGVDRKTITRWIQGKVKSIQPANAKALTDILNCEMSDLCLNDEASQLATMEDQKIAAQLLQTSSIIDKLGPIGEWNVIEGLLKAIIVPNLPLQVIGDLYNQLTIACWRQSKIDQALTFNNKALEIAKKLNDKTILASALLSKANILSWRGETESSILTYNECLSLKKFLQIRTLGSIFSNLGAVYYETGDLAAGLEYQKKAIEQFEVYGKAMNLSIAHTHIAMIYLQMLDLISSEAACLQSIEYAKQDEYKRGIQMGQLILAELYARTGRQSEACIMIKKTLFEFQKMNIEEGLNYEYAGRVFRIAKDFAQAKIFLQRGIEITHDYPIYQAALYQELAQLAVDSKAPHQEIVAAAHSAKQIFQNCGAKIRALAIENTFLRGNYA